MANKPTKKLSPYNLYSETLVAMGYSIADDGGVSRPGKGGFVPVEVAEVPLYLPTEPLLEKNKWDNLAPYHPLSENIIRGQSPVLQTIIRDLEVWITLQLYNIATVIHQVASTPELQGELIAANKSVSEILSGCGVGASEKTFKAWATLLPKITAEGLRPVRLYINRKYTHGENTFSRMGIVSYPILENSAENDALICGVTCGSKANKKVIIDILKYILDPLETHIGSNEAAPYYHVLLQFQRQMVKRFNDLNSAFESKYPFVEINEEWFEDVDNLARFSGVIPSLPYNEGLLPSEIKSSDAESLYDTNKVKTTYKSRSVLEREERERNSGSGDVRDRRSDRDRRDDRRDRDDRDDRRRSDADDYLSRDRRDDRDDYDDYDDRDDRRSRRSFRDDYDDGRRRSRDSGRRSDRGRRSRRGDRDRRDDRDYDRRDDRDRSDVDDYLS